MFRSGQCLWVWQGCGWVEFRNALFQKIYPVFLPPIPWLAAVSVIENLPIRGFLSAAIAVAKGLATFERAIAKGLGDAMHRLKPNSHQVVKGVMSWVGHAPKWSQVIIYYYKKIKTDPSFSCLDFWLLSLPSPVFSLALFSFSISCSPEP